MDILNEALRKLKRLEGEIERLKTIEKSEVYPIGAVYISVSATSPATLFGGTWESFGAGRVLVGLNAGDADFSTVEKTGGSKTSSGTMTHTHSVGVGNHRHTTVHGWNINNEYYAGGDYPYYGSTVVTIPRYVKTKSLGDYSASAGAQLAFTSYAHSISNVTSGEASRSAVDVSTVQPYITVYMWKRTA